MKLFFKCIDDVPTPIVEAYDAGRYTFDPNNLPCQAHTHWLKVDWINFVRFAPDLETLRAAK